MSINSVSITGRLTEDPTAREAGGTKVLEMRVAINNQRKNPQTGEWVEDPCYIDVSYFTAGADKMAAMLHKGSHIGVTGQLRQDSWTNKDGEKHSKVYIRANDFEFLDAKAQQ